MAMPQGGEERDENMATARKASASTRKASGGKLVEPPAQAPTVPKTTLADQAYALLWRRITEMEMPPGLWFNERDLSKEIGFGAMPLREALDRLAASGMVRTIPRRGHQVTPITHKHIEDYFDMLAPFAGAVFALACSKCTPQELDEVVALIDRARKADRPGSAAAQWHEHSGKLFNRLIQIADNEHYDAVWHRLEGVNIRLFSVMVSRSPVDAWSGAAGFGPLFRARDIPALRAGVEAFVQTVRAALRHIEVDVSA
jgi:DNA-binding GntR family transcriptional regulator